MASIFYTNNTNNTIEVMYVGPQSSSIFPKNISLNPADTSIILYPGDKSKSPLIPTSQFIAIYVWITYPSNLNSHGNRKKCNTDTRSNTSITLTKQSNASIVANSSKIVVSSYSDGKISVPLPEDSLNDGYSFTPPPIELFNAGVSSINYRYTYINYAGGCGRNNSNSIIFNNLTTSTPEEVILPKQRKRVPGPTFSDNPGVLDTLIFLRTPSLLSDSDDGEFPNAYLIVDSTGKFLSSHTDGTISITHSGTNSYTLVSTPDVISNTSANPSSKPYIIVAIIVTVIFVFILLFSMNFIIRK